MVDVVFESHIVVEFFGCVMFQLVGYGREKVGVI